jgi:hypothetical protein
LPWNCSWQKLKDFCKNEQPDGTCLEIDHVVCDLLHRLCSFLQTPQESALSARMFSIFWTIPDLPRITAYSKIRNSTSMPMEAEQMDG